MKPPPPRMIAVAGSLALALGGCAGVQRHAALREPGSTQLVHAPSVQPPVPPRFDVDVGVPLLAGLLFLPVVAPVAVIVSEHRTRRLRSELGPVDPVPALLEGSRQTGPELSSGPTASAYLLWIEVTSIHVEPEPRAQPLSRVTLSAVATLYQRGGQRRLWRETCARTHPARAAGAEVERQIQFLAGECGRLLGASFARAQ